MTEVLQVRTEGRTEGRTEKAKSSSLERGTDGRITINIQQPEVPVSNPGNPDDGARKGRKLIQFFPVSASASPKRRKEESDSDAQRPMKGFIGSVYTSKDKAGPGFFLFTPILHTYTMFASQTAQLGLLSFI